MAELRPRTVKLIDLFAERWRPLLHRGESPYLFPLNGLGHERTEQTALAGFAGRLSRLVRRRLDIPFNIHALRGLTATLYADANPGDILTVKAKLGHRDDRTTQRFYIDPQQKEMIRRFDALVDRLVEHCKPAPVRSRREMVLDVV
jgi:integrase